ncbi:MAG: VOC family protein [Propionibacteriaceae bacterium]
MSRMLFVNLPVKNLQRSVDFFTQLGFEFNAQFTDENATSMVINDQATVMLLVEDFFQTFTDRRVADATSATEVLVAFSVSEKSQVDTVVEAALASGGSPHKDKKDEGFMYGWSFCDPDGHVWEVMWMDAAAVGS